MSFQQYFLKACEIGNFDKVKSLLFNENVNLAYDKNLAIELASNNGHYNIIQLASFYGHENVIKFLLDNNRVINFVKISDDNNLAILWASFYGHYNVIKLLLKHINSFNNDIINYIKKNCSKKIRQLVVVLQKLFQFI